MAATLVTIPTRGEVGLKGELSLPAGSRCLVVVAYGPSATDPRPVTRQIAGRLERSGYATLQVPLVTPPEDAVDRHDGGLGGDVALLGRRLVGVIDWIASRSLLKGYPLGILGSSSAAAAALVAAALRPGAASAVVSCGGRPDLAAPVLGWVGTPTLFVVGGREAVELGLTRAACAKINAVRHLEVLPATSQRFEASGALERAVRVINAWFERWLRPAGAALIAGTERAEPSAG